MSDINVRPIKVSFGGSLVETPPGTVGQVLEALGSRTPIKEGVFTQSVFVVGAGGGTSVRVEDVNYPVEAGSTIVVQKNFDNG